MIKAILACDDVGGIGLDGRMPWPYNSTDLQRFRECTSGHVVVMGSKTWNSKGMPKPLPNRINYVFSTQPNKIIGADDVYCNEVTGTIQDIAKKHQGLITWIIGGAYIINQCWAIIDEFHLSRIPGNYNCDTKIELSKLNNFILCNEEIHPDVTFQIYKHIRVRFP